MGRRFADLEKTLRRAGWESVKRRRHVVWRCPCGEHQVTMSRSPSDRRARKNARAVIRRQECMSLEGEI